MLQKTKIFGWFKTQLFTLIGTGVGIAAGYVYYRQVGCSGDACPITSNPYKTMFLFAIMGASFGSIFVKKQP